MWRISTSWKKIFDENNRESQEGLVNGLGLLDIETYFKNDSSEEKIVEQSEGIILKSDESSMKTNRYNTNDSEKNGSKTNNSETNSHNNNDIFSSIIGKIVNGYEIHERITIINDDEPLLKIKKGIGTKKNYLKINYMMEQKEEISLEAISMEYSIIIILEENF